jgi:hypothetical protein
LRRADLIRRWICAELERLQGKLGLKEISRAWRPLHHPDKVGPSRGGIPKAYKILSTNYPKVVEPQDEEDEDEEDEDDDDDEADQVLARAKSKFIQNYRCQNPEPF